MLDAEKVGEIEMFVMLESEEAPMVLTVLAELELEPVELAALVE